MEGRKRGGSNAPQVVKKSPSVGRHRAIEPGLQEGLLWQVKGLGDLLISENKKKKGGIGKGGKKHTDREKAHILRTLPKAAGRM